MGVAAKPKSSVEAFLVAKTSDLGGQHQRAISLGEGLEVP